MDQRLLGELARFRVHHGNGLLLCMQIASWNLQLCLLRPEPFWLYHKVYWGRSEAAFVMSSVTNEYLINPNRIVSDRADDIAGHPSVLAVRGLGQTLSVCASPFDSRTSNV